MLQVDRMKEVDVLRKKNSNIKDKQKERMKEIQAEIASHKVVEHREICEQKVKHDQIICREKEENVAQKK